MMGAARRLKLSAVRLLSIVLRGVGLEAASWPEDKNTGDIPSDFPARPRSRLTQNPAVQRLYDLRDARTCVGRLSYFRIRANARANAKYLLIVLLGVRLEAESWLEDKNTGDTPSDFPALQRSNA
jgi:hypothetical protein